MKGSSAIMFVMLLPGLTGCKKPVLPEPVEEQVSDIELQRGLPSDPEKLNGYMLVLDDNSVFGVKNAGWIYYFACFSEQPRPMRHYFDKHRLMVLEPDVNSNLSAGTLKANDSVLHFLELPGQRGFYLKDFRAVDTLKSIKWEIGGNRSLPSEKVSLSSVMPRVNTDSKYIQIQNKTSPYTLNIDTVFADFDSAFVDIFNYSFTLRSAHRVVTHGQQYVVFEPKDLALINNSGSTSTLVFQASKFYHFRRNGRMIILEYSRQVAKRLY